MAPVILVLVAFALYAWLESRREAQARLAAVVELATGDRPDAKVQGRQAG